MSARPTAVIWAGALTIDATSRKATIGFPVIHSDGARLEVSLPLAEAKLMALAIIEHEARDAVDADDVEERKP